jgi:hypothetical protein
MLNLKSLVFASAMLLLAVGVSAAEPKQDDAKSESAPAEKTAAEETRPVSAAPPAAGGPVVYQPPKLGKPARTVGGGSRGSSDKVPALYVLAPEHVGRTTSADPSLYWYIDRVPDPSHQIEFTLLDEESVEPLIEKVLTNPKRPGIQQIRLADYGVRLAQGTEYEWSVALILDPNERSKDIVATSWIDRVEPSPQLASRLATEGGARTAAVYADAGMWYDAVAALSDQIDRDPANAQLRQQRADLLRQVGLDAAASGEGR